MNNADLEKLETFAGGVMVAAAIGLAVGVCGLAWWLS